MTCVPQFRLWLPNLIVIATLSRSRADEPALVSCRRAGSLTAAFGADVLPGVPVRSTCRTGAAAPASQPLAILRPRSADELSRMLAICHAHGERWCRRAASPACVAARCRPRRRGGGVARAHEPHRAHRHRFGHRHRRARAILQTVQEACRDAGALLAVDLGAPAAPAGGRQRVDQRGRQPGDPLRQHPRPGARLEVVLADGTVLSMLNQMVKQRQHGPQTHLFIGSGACSASSPGWCSSCSRCPKGREAPRWSRCTTLPRCASCAMRSRALSDRSSAFEIIMERLPGHRGRRRAARAPLDTNYPVYIADRHALRPAGDRRRALRGDAGTGHRRAGSSTARWRSR